MRDKVYKTISIDKIIPNQKQPRKHFDENKINELSISIKNNGLVQPIVVRKLDGNYQIIAGERRYRACKLAGLKEVPCLITKYDNEEVDTLAIIENIQRENLSPIEEANAYLMLMKVHGYNQSELAQKIGKKQSTVANKIRLLKLDDDVQFAISKNQITERHGRAMLGLDAEKQQEVLKEVLHKSLTVKQTENIIHKKPKAKKVKKSISQNVKIAVNTLNQAIKMIEQSGVVLQQTEEDQEAEYTITIRIKK